jgi:hypothetical protein
VSTQRVQFKVKDLHYSDTDAVVLASQDRRVVAGKEADRNCGFAGIFWKERG